MNMEIVIWNENNKFSNKSVMCRFQYLTRNTTTLNKHLKKSEHGCNSE